MRYFINGEEVKESTFDRDLNDNFNAKIPCKVVQDEFVYSMTYNDEEQAGPAAIVEKPKIKYCYTFAKAIEETERLKKIQNGYLLKGNISAIAKRHHIRVKDLTVILKDEGII